MRLATLFLLLFLPAIATAAPAPRLTVEGPTKYKPYSLVRIKASGVDDKAAIVWRVTPKANVSRATTPRGVLEFVAPPGVYQVECQVLTINKAGGIDSEESETEIEIERGCDQVPPSVPPTIPPMVPPPKPLPKADPHAALGRIQFTNAGCTATVIWPRRADGRWDLLTAAHCIQHVGVGAKGACQLRDGTKFGVKVVSLHEQSDCAWLVTESADLGDLPFALLAPANPAAGVKVWHAGYGVDVPGNREDGTVTSPTNSEGQTEFAISVSSGDSGGGIFRTDTGELVGTVCCTTAKGQRARVWGASVDAFTKRRPKSDSSEIDWFTPVEIPEREVGKGGTADWWTPIEMPERTVRGPVVIDLRGPMPSK